MFLRGKTVSQFRIAAVTREAREFGMILVGGAPSFGRQGLQLSLIHICRHRSRCIFLRLYE